HQEVMHVQRMGNRHNRGITRAHIGTTLEDPFINYAQIVKGMGVYSEGPISNPNDLGPALARALAVVKKGEPALVDVVTQPRYVNDEETISIHLCFRVGLGDCVRVGNCGGYRRTA